MLSSNRIFDTIVESSGAFQHGHTYNAHLTACAAALAVQKTIREDNLLAAVRERGAELRAALEDRFGNHHHIGNIRGRGLFMALEIVQDRARKTPFPVNARIAQRLKGIALDKGLLCYPTQGTADGVLGDHVMVAPPFIVTSSHIAEIVDKLGDAVDEAIRTAPAS